MSKESAQSFVANFFEDDDIVRQLYEKGAITSDKDADKEEQAKKIAEAAKSMGYDFDASEFAKANREYLEPLGPMKAGKKIMHTVKVVKKLEKGKK